MTVRDAAQQVLRQAGRPLRYTEITDRILARKLWAPRTKTPAATVEARIASEIRSNGDSSEFVRTAPRTFGLRELGAQPMRVKPGRARKQRRKRKSAAAPTYSFTEAASRVLDQFGSKQPMHYRDITRKALEMGWLDTKGKTPEASMYAAIGAEIRRYKKRGEQPRFAQHGKGYVGLTRWMGRGLAFEIEQHNRRVRRALHRRLFGMDPTAFEELIGQLLAALGFEEIQVTQRSGDGGIDVRGTLVVGDVIRTRMAVQVKKWKKSSNVQKPIVQQVRGSLGAHEQGLIITTSDFSKGAEEEASRPDAVPVGLMNGEQLVKLLIEHDIGVSRVTHDLIELSEGQAEPGDRQPGSEALADTQPSSEPATRTRGPKTANKRGRTRRRQEGVSVAITGLPTQREMEVPLLRAILRRGGSVSGKEQRRRLADDLAEDFGLTRAQQGAKGAGHTDSVWLKQLRWVRQNLVLKGDMARGPRGVWAVTEQGRARLDQQRATNGD